MVEEVCRFILVRAEQKKVLIYLKRVRPAILGKQRELVSVGNAASEGRNGRASGDYRGRKNASPFSAGRVDLRTRCNKGDLHGCLPTVELTGNEQNSKGRFANTKT